MSAVRFADVAAFDQMSDTYDTVHPGAAGELKIAAAVADALAELGIGTPIARPLPPVPNVPRRPATLTATAGDGTVLLHWSNPPGATRERVWMRDATAGSGWEALPLTVSDTQWRVGPLSNRHAYEFRLQAAKKDLFSEVLSNTVAVNPLPDAVEGLTVRPRPHGLRVEWLATATGSYTVRWGRHQLSTAATAVTLRDLTAGKRYRVTVRSGAASANGHGVPKGPVPGPPRGLRRSGDRLAWRPAVNATRYQVLRRRGSSWHQIGWTARTRFPVGSSGRFSVRSWHQHVAGGRTFVRG